MDTLDHDPKTKSQIKDALFTFLYDPVRKQFKTRIETLIGRNTLIGGFAHKHFVYQGALYNAEPTTPPVRKNRLVPQLREPMDEYLRDLAELNNHELPYVLGFINQVLNASNALDDYLQVLPESTHQPVRQLAATCPCRIAVLSPEKIEQLKLKNEESINLIKRRLVTNLLI